MTTTIEVRRARPAEFDAVGALLGDTYLAEGWASGGYLPVLRDVAARAAQSLVLVALEDGRVVGSVTVATGGGRYAEQAGPGEAVVRMLLTDPALRGRGVGGALMDAALDAAVADGCTRVRLSTQAEMASAHRLYERLGFVRTPGDDWSPELGLTLLTYALDLAVWCGHCGQRVGPGGERGGHPACRQAAELEPPRYCAQCCRRMVVQVTPTGWSARCSVHGTVTG